MQFRKRIMCPIDSVPDTNEIAVVRPRMRWWNFSPIASNYDWDSIKNGR